MHVIYRLLFAAIAKEDIRGSDKQRLSVKYLSLFFQAEDGIRDLTVTGVQTCALPISRRVPARSSTSSHRWATSGPSSTRKAAATRPPRRRAPPGWRRMTLGRILPNLSTEIGRASCRERG